MIPKCKIMFGTISYLPDSLKYLDTRVQNHIKQLRWLEQAPMPLNYYRVEVGWSANTKSRITSDLQINTIEVEPPSPPGASRNVLLRYFYESDYDYLVCMDDDQVLDPILEGFDFIAQLTPKLASEGALMLFKPDVYLTKPAKETLHKRRTSEPGLSNHLLKKASCTGDMQISCIPNIKKYRGLELFFDSESMAQEGEIPEDAKFLVDWVLSKLPVYQCLTIVNEALDNYSSSSIYDTKAFRGATSRPRVEVLNAYIKSRIGNNPRINTWKDVCRYRNHARDQLLVAKGKTTEYAT